MEEKKIRAYVFGDGFEVVTNAVLDLEEHLNSIFETEYSRKEKQILDEIYFCDTIDQKKELIKSKLLELKRSILNETSGELFISYNKEELKRWEDIKINFSGIINSNHYTKLAYYIVEYSTQFDIYPDYYVSTSYWLKDDYDIITIYDDRIVDNNKTTIYHDDRLNGSYDFIENILIEKGVHLNPLSDYKLYTFLQSEYNNLLDFEDLHEIENGEPIDIVVSKQIIILHEMGILENIKRNNNFIDNLPVAKEVKKLLGTTKDTQSVVNAILNDNNTKNPYKSKQKDLVNFIKEVRKLLKKE